MAKYYEFKVFNTNDDYITTWKDVISEVNFTNEINSAGGELKVTLARNAGDYGEGTDLNFGYKVKVYCFDDEQPAGQVIFQGYISSYNPIYKDDNVEVTLLGYGSELNDYIIEAGETAYLTQSTSNATEFYGSTSSFGIVSQTWVMQTFTVAGTVQISSCTFKLTIPSAVNHTASIYQMAGATPNLSSDSLISTGTVSIGPGTSQDYTIAFNQPNALVTGKTYYVSLTNSGNSAYAGISSTSTYAGGQLYKQSKVNNVWTSVTSKATNDLYFILNQYSGNTTKTYTSQEPTAILTELVKNYNSRGGSLTIPQPLATNSIKQLSETNTLPVAGTRANVFAQTIIPNKNITFQYVQFRAAVTSLSAFFRPQINKGNPLTDVVNVTSITSRSITLGAGNSILANLVQYPSNATTINNTTVQTITCKSSVPITMNRGESYYLVFGDNTTSTSPVTNLIVKGASSADIIDDTSIGQLVYVNASANGNYNLSYNSTYPAVTVKFFQDDPTINDGYTSTGTTATYTFRVQTMFEGTNVIKDLSPENWYWYVDQGRNELHLKEKSLEPDHVFSLEKDIIDAKFEKSTEEIVNTLYFTGGDTGGGTNFYKKYYDADSIATYGVKSAKYTDARVTLTSTADAIGNNIIATKSQPELHVTLEILDSNNNQGMGYDIESLQVGDVIAVRNVTQQVGLSTWDIARWDEARWDYNIYNLSSLRMQIQRIDYKTDTAVISASTIPVDISKRIEVINRDLEDLQTQFNPTAPS